MPVSASQGRRPVCLQPSTRVLTPCERSSPARLKGILAHPAALFQFLHSVRHVFLFVCSFVPTTSVVPTVTSSMISGSWLCVSVLTTPPPRTYTGAWHVVAWKSAPPPQKRPPAWLQKLGPGASSRSLTAAKTRRKQLPRKWDCRDSCDVLQRIIRIHISPGEKTEPFRFPAQGLTSSNLWKSDLSKRLITGS